jgi:hypothetical protein
VLAGLELTPTARFDEEEKTRVGRRARPPMLLQLVRTGTDVEAAPLFRNACASSTFNAVGPDAIGWMYIGLIVSVGRVADRVRQVEQVNQRHACQADDGEGARDAVTDGLSRVCVLLGNCHREEGLIGTYRAPGA